LTYLDLSKVLISKDEKKERPLRFYRRYNFKLIYIKFDAENYKKFELPFTRYKWKELIKKFDKISDIIWRITKFRRSTVDWTSIKIQRMHRLIFNLSRLIKDVHEDLLSIVTEEEMVWRNLMLQMPRILSSRKIGLSKDDMYEAMPTSRVGSFRLAIRQTFTPLERVIDAIELDLIAGEVDEEKFRQLEDGLLLKVIPWFYKVFSEVVSRQ